MVYLSKSDANWTFLVLPGLIMAIITGRLSPILTPQMNE